MIEFDLEAMNAITEKEQKLEALAADVRFLARQTAQNIIAMGKRLTEIKGLLPHGEFGAYIEEHCGFAERTARRFMRIADEYTVDSLPEGVTPRKLDELLSLPAAEREEFIATHDVEDLSVRQLRAEISRVKAERDQQAEQLCATIDQAQRKVSESELRALNWQRKAEGLDRTLDETLAENEQLRTRNEALQAQAESAVPSMDAVRQNSLFRCAESAREKAEKRVIDLEEDLARQQGHNADLEAEVFRLGAENMRLKEAALVPAPAPQRMSTYIQTREALDMLKERLFDLAPIIDEACGLDSNPAWGAWLDEVCGELARVSGTLTEATARIMQGLERAENNE